MKLKVYVAGPMTHGDRFENVRRAINVGKELMLAGYAPMCPQLDYYLFPEAEPDWNMVLSSDESWVAVTDVVFRLDGYSPGADREVAFATQRGIPVVYSRRELDKYRGKWELADETAREPDSILIGITGFKGAGKDTAAKPLISRGFERIAFADNVRKMALTIDPFVPALVAMPDGTTEDGAAIRLSAVVDQFGWDKAKENPEIRRLLQVIGTDAVRGIVGETVWVDAWKSEALPSLAEDTSVVVTDVRFPNEERLIHDLGGVVWRVDRPGHESDGHASEQYVETMNVDKVLENDQGIGYLHFQVTEALSSLTAKRPSVNIQS